MLELENITGNMSATNELVWSRMAQLIPSMKGGAFVLKKGDREFFIVELHIFYYSYKEKYMECYCLKAKKFQAFWRRLRRGAGADSGSSSGLGSRFRRGEAIIALN